MGYFSKTVESRLHYFEDLKADIAKSGMDLTVRQYLSVALMTVTLTFVIELPFLAFIGGVLPGFSTVTAIFFAFTMTTFFCIAISFFFYTYPSILARNRAKRINNSLPFAATYLATVSGSDAPPRTVFEIFSEFVEFKEISGEIEKIMKDIKLLGISTSEAILRAIKDSPSDKLKDLLWGISSTVKSGGSLPAYLHSKADAYVREYRRSLDQYFNMLSVLKIYLILTIAGLVFFITISPLLLGAGASETMESLVLLSQFSIVFVVLPGIFIVFIYALKKSSRRGWE